jgi:hypothetical protein
MCFGLQRHLQWHWDLCVSASNVIWSDTWTYVFRPERSPVVTLGPTCFGPQGHLQWHLDLCVSASAIWSDTWTYVFRPTRSPAVTFGPICFSLRHLKWYLDLRVSARKVACSDTWPYVFRPARSPAVTLNLNVSYCCAQCLFIRMSSLIRRRITLRVQAGRDNELYFTHNYNHYHIVVKSFSLGNK